MVGILKTFYTSVLYFFFLLTPAFLLLPFLTVIRHLPTVILLNKKGHGTLKAPWPGGVVCERSCGFHFYGDQ
jgi:hypothetical protein